MARVQDLHGGRDYEAHFGTRMRGQGIWADLLRQRFTRACRRLGLTGPRLPLQTAHFQPQALRAQRSLF